MNIKNSTATVLVLIAVGLFYTFINPQYQKTKTLQAEAQQYENVLSNTSAISEVRNELMTRLADIPSSDIDRLSKILPDNIDTVRLAKDLDAIASNHGISITSLQIDSSADDNTGVFQQDSGSSYEKVILTLNFVSNYENFRMFLNDIERSLRIIDIKSISFQVGTTDFYEFRVSFETYWLTQ